MNITDKSIDGGKAFDWGKTSADYAKFRDIYPQEFYDRIVLRNLCINGQSILDVGTGTGVLPRNMYHYGANWTGTDISENQIKQAKTLSEGMNIDYYALSAEDINFPDHSFDAITACQCFWYFNHEQNVSKFHRMLRPNGSILVLYMAWLPYEDKIAGESEKQNDWEIGFRHYRGSGFSICNIDDIWFIYGCHFCKLFIQHIYCNRICAIYDCALQCERR